jgi:uncharacterized protein (TIGR00730 family)
VSLNSLCVFCGAAPGKRSVYVAAARELGKELARREITLVYGGGGVGMMGALSRAALAAGGRVIGVIPEALVARERVPGDLSDVRIVGSMHERKALMHDLAQAFVVLPGGLGTLEELLEIVTWSQLGLHDKPITLFDVGDYFTPLEAVLDHAVAEGFLGQPGRALVRRARAVDEALALSS